MVRATDHVIGGPRLVAVIPTDSQQVWHALLNATSPATNHEPHDAFHLAAMQAFAITGIATSDPDFAGVPGLTMIDFRV